MLFHTAYFYDLTLNKIKVMKKFLLILTFVFSIGFIDGQTTFFKTIGGYNEFSNCVEQTSDGGYMLVGSSESPTSLNGYLIKTNSSGDTLWTKLYGNEAQLVMGKQTSDGGYILTGEIKNTSTLDLDIYVVKTDSIGNSSWQKIIATINDDESYDVKQTSDGGYIILGYGTRTGGSTSDIFVIKLDSSGNLDWKKFYGSNTEYEYGYSIIQTADGGYMICGDSYEMSSGYRGYILKIGSSGTYYWSKIFDGSSHDRSTRILQTTDYGYIILGTRGSGSGSNDMCILRTNSSGNPIWGKTYFGTYGDCSWSINKTNAGNYIISTSSLYTTSMQQVLFVLVDSLGTEIWNRSFNDYTGAPQLSTGSSAIETSDGGFIFTGSSITASIGGYMYFIKTDSTGSNSCESTLPLTPGTYFPTVITPSNTVGSGGTISTILIPETNRANPLINQCLSVSINELPPTQQISVYPNPSSGQFNFSGIEIESKIEVFDMIGKVIYQSIANSNFETINIFDKATGIYFYRITKELKLVQSGKICVQ